MWFIACVMLPEADCFLLPEADLYFIDQTRHPD
jgi:hypothetical protein